MCFWGSVVNKKLSPSKSNTPEQARTLRKKKGQVLRVTPGEQREGKEVFVLCVSKHPSYIRPLENPEKKTPLLLSFFLLVGELGKV